MTVVTRDLQNLKTYPNYPWSSSLFSKVYSLPLVLQDQSYDFRENSCSSSPECHLNLFYMPLLDAHSVPGFEIKGYG